MRYMLDTNMVTHILKQHPTVMQKLMSVPMQSLCISAITEAELSYGVAKRPNAVKLRNLVREFLLRVDVLPFDRLVAYEYGIFKAKVEAEGKSLSALDMQIAAHAYTIGATLVTNDQAFKQIQLLSVEDWTVEMKNE